MSGRTLRFAVFGNEYQGKKSVAIQKIVVVEQWWLSTDRSMIFFWQSMSI